MTSTELALEAVCLGKPAMGTRCELRLGAPPRPPARAGALALLVSEVAWIDRAEAELSRFRPESGLCRLNAAPEAAVPVSPLLAGALAGALAMAAETGGLCHPALLPWLEAAGYDRTRADLPADGPPLPAPADGLLLPTPAAAPPNLPVQVRGSWVTRPPGLRLDLGGTAKGWAADRIAARLSRHGPALAALGGDLRAHAPDGAPAWEVPVADPRAPGQTMAILRVRDAGVATSGTGGRRWRRGGRWQHHIIDPRTGSPAATPVIQATVVAPTALQAEAWAKAAVLLGPDAGLEALERRGLGGLLVLRDGTAAWNGAMGRYLYACRTIRD